ncbi:unnamed protein product (macronuclear) [Paramecium tetraurelia]|uniref:Uncharacterized protein n=1 Tax=Paramecium tetraurelia TaxID=5888 RepID=A0CB61_PARTE|nr:uncharacterized protein GSPATT00036811001 [Paramecium tetraurelia]CAK68028.1 unnamed protein product [Paramecium tetraurelia]|eukprot:XP_001435425.1 hypothetical protein (macronuclear) [Paramecium tetraurelia strain d4-2]
MQEQRLGGTEELIKKIYEGLLPPALFRSNIQFYEEEKEMKRDCKSYHFGDYQIEIIQYQIELDKIQMNKDRERREQKEKEQKEKEQREKEIQREKPLQNESNKNPQNDPNKVDVYHFSIKNLLPKSQLLEFTAYVKSEYGCKILKTKASTTKLELHLDPDTTKSQKQIYVFLGQAPGKFKIRLSNYVLLEEM